MTDKEKRAHDVALTCMAAFLNRMKEENLPDEFNKLTNQTEQNGYGSFDAIEFYRSVYQHALDSI